MDSAEAMNGEQIVGGSSSNAKLHIGQNGPSLYRRGMEVRNPMQGGLSESNVFLCILCCLNICIQSMISLPFLPFYSMHSLTTCEWIRQSIPY